MDVQCTKVSLHDWMLLLAVRVSRFAPVYYGPAVACRMILKGGVCAGFTYRSTRNRWPSGVTS